MTTALADLPLWAMYAVMLGWALVRGAFFYAVGASTRVDRPLVQRLTARFTKGPVQTAMTKVERLGGRAVTTTYAVSYTHLDVYKRQVLNWAPPNRN